MKLKSGQTRQSDGGISYSNNIHGSGDRGDRGEEDKNKIEPLTNEPLLTLIASLSQTKQKIINWLRSNGTRMFNY